MNDIHQNSSLQSFRKTVQANWTDMRRTVFVEAVQSGGNIHFKYNYKNMTYKIISDNWIYKLKRCGKELGYSQEEIDDAVYCFPGEISVNCHLIRS